ncbi:Leucine Rich Repeat family [Brachionus plicatilis]|uniref:Leucine Rich Repeat family n=1 Tax=Brachionus plicatilis TaxID=10195 RepID=A0A3M7R2B3_BRAPC|nr:Leucine Rich Repeat family [Brachionus plicatilis]
MNFILASIIIVSIPVLCLAQSTCPVSQRASDPQRCKCGIKIDGHIYIYCARKQLTSLPKFTRSAILYDELILSGNQIHSVSRNDFAGLKVKRLLLDDNPMERIEAGSFAELANYLEEMILSVNSYSVLNRPKIQLDLFQNLLNLKIIKLNGFDIGDFSYLKANVFNRTRKLESLHLIDAGLTAIEPNSLSGLESSLKELSLDNNLLSNTDQIFAQIKRLTRLSTLSLSRNRIRQIARYSGPRINMRDVSIDLSFNGIVNVDEYAFGLGGFDSTGLASAISKLSLNNNELNHFQLDFLNQLQNLRELHLDANKIDIIGDNMFANLRHLQVLSLRGNNIRFVRNELAFAGLGFSLKKLNLAANKLESIEPAVLSTLAKLTELNLERNNLGNGNADQLFSGQSQLRVLNLENNNLRGEHFLYVQNLLNLEHLKIGNNNFAHMQLKAVLNDESEWRSIRQVFVRHKSLSVLEIQNASLTQMPYFAGLNSSLTNLNVAFNKICNINGLNMRKFYTKVNVMNVYQNPISCCDIKSFRDWSVGLLNSNSSEFKCSHPELGKIDIINSKLDCDNQESCVVDYGQVYLREFYSRTTPTTTKAMATTQMDTIVIVESSASTPTAPSTTKPALLLKTSEQILFPRKQPQANSFMYAVELKQTLLGSIIGALSVLIIVLIFVCIIKSRKKFGKDLSLCSSDKDKSNVTNSTSPYELGKLSLQTLCLNSNCSTASTSSSTNSCACNLMNNGDMFQKMDPMRLTMLKHPAYLTNMSNLHYLASNLPYTPGQSSSTSPTPYLTNDETNQYDKLQRLANASSFSTLKPVGNINSVFAYPSQLLTSTLSFHQRQKFANSETTPFLILSNQAVKMPELVKQESINGANPSQHTYHEIGDVLMQNINSYSRGKALNQQNDSKGNQQNELYI